MIFVIKIMYITFYNYHVYCIKNMIFYYIFRKTKNKISTFLRSRMTMCLQNIVYLLKFFFFSLSKTTLVFKVQNNLINYLDVPLNWVFFIYLLLLTLYCLKPLMKQEIFNIKKLITTFKYSK